MLYSIGTNGTILFVGTKINRSILYLISTNTQCGLIVFTNYEILLFLYLLEKLWSVNEGLSTILGLSDIIWKIL